MSPSLVTLFGNDINDRQMYYNKDTGEMGFALTAAAVGKGLSSVFGLIGKGIKAKKAKKKKAAQEKQIALQNASANQAAQLAKLKKQKIIKIVAISGGLLVVTLTALYFLKR